MQCKGSRGRLHSLYMACQSRSCLSGKARLHHALMVGPASRVEPILLARYGARAHPWQTVALGNKTSSLVLLLDAMYPIRQLTYSSVARQKLPMHRLRISALCLFLCPELMFCAGINITTQEWVSHTIIGSQANINPVNNGL